MVASEGILLMSTVESRVVAVEQTLPVWDSTPTRRYEPSARGSDAYYRRQILTILTSIDVRFWRTERVQYCGNAVKSVNKYDL